MRVQWHAFISPLRVECEEACADARCQRIFTPLLKQLAGALGIVGASGGGIKRSEILIRAEVGRIDTNDCFKRSCGAVYPSQSVECCSKLALDQAIAWKLAPQLNQFVSCGLVLTLPAQDDGVIEARAWQRRVQLERRVAQFCCLVQLIAFRTVTFGAQFGDGCADEIVRIIRLDLMRLGAL